MFQDFAARHHPLKMTHISDLQTGVSGKAVLANTKHSNF